MSLRASGTDFSLALRGKHVVVIGLGKSGVAAARLAHGCGARVLGIDGMPSEKLDTSKLDPGIEIIAGMEPRLADARTLGAESLFDALARADLIIVSPGVPPFLALRREEDRGAVVIGEIDFAMRFFHETPSIAITGSNGKSTTTTLVGELLAEAGLAPLVGGNLGDPPAAWAEQALAVRSQARVVVLEVSSFQAERLPTYRPSSAALLNVSPNHLDRYDSFDAYVHAKGNLFVHQTAKDEAIVPIGDARCLAEAKRGRGRVVTFGRLSDGADVGFDAERVLESATGFSAARNQILIEGEHNMLNVCAALALVAPFGLSDAVKRSVLARFRGLEHRLAFVREIAGIRFFDDSKGTNVGATVAAISGLEASRVVLIAGGRDKLGSYEPLVDALVSKGRAAVLIGEAADRIASALRGKLLVQYATSMQNAVEQAYALACEGDAVLLSPACSSFDMFRDYKDRAAAFVDAVNALDPRGESSAAESSAIGGGA